MTQMSVSRTAFKEFNRLMILLWRLGLGPWINISPEVGGRIMVLTTIGRRSGLKRRTPVNYAPGDGEVYCLAGFGKTADWYRNLLANPEVEVWLPGGRWIGRAEEVTDPEERLPLVRQILINSGFAASAFAGIDPHTISDESLQEVAADWPVLRIRLERPLSGPDGPGDLTWVWPTVGIIILVWLWRRWRRD
ncbi:MAG TPA: nitroreductase family deazaflavin-dependent oxidoreductase [Caldilineae bacterium]|nr:nitroreductase family deazaflavin-dependent oxidoreductase [Caldilineae bacterium]